MTLKMPCSHRKTTRSLFVCFALVTLADSRLSFRRKGCAPPELPAHSAYLCQVPLCKEPDPDSGLFRPETVLEFYCQPGYVTTSLPAFAICQRGQWNMLREFDCTPQATPRPDAFISVASVPMVLAAAVIFSAILVTVAACVLVRTRLRFCRCLSSYENLDDSLDQIEELDVLELDCSGGPLPSYEEAVYGHTEHPWPAGAQGPAPLVLSQESWGPPDHRSLGEDPPSYHNSLGAVSAESGSAPGRGSPSWLPTQLLPPAAGNKGGP